MTTFLHIRYNPNGDDDGKWAVHTSRGALKGNLPTFEAADADAKDFVYNRVPGSGRAVYGEHDATV